MFWYFLCISLRTWHYRSWLLLGIEHSSSNGGSDFKKLFGFYFDKVHCRKIETTRKVVPLLPQYPWVCFMAPLSANITLLSYSPSLLRLNLDSGIVFLDSPTPFVLRYCAKCWVYIARVGKSISSILEVQVELLFSLSLSLSLRLLHFPPPPSLFFATVNLTHIMRIRNFTSMT